MRDGHGREVRPGDLVTLIDWSNAVGEDILGLVLTVVAEGGTVLCLYRTPDGVRVTLRHTVVAVLCSRPEVE